ncbi:1-aminocyclopropane-1-carboxylate oxidase protein [Trifolium repens]|nr:1-aminocyclopropane-1-carboxylate oxidase protein [Trifolium repens]
MEGESAASNYDRKREAKVFDNSKAGVEGLIENGVTKVPHSSEVADGVFNNNEVRVHLDKVRRNPKSLCWFLSLFVVEGKNKSYEVVVEDGRLFYKQSGGLLTLPKKVHVVYALHFAG